MEGACDDTRLIINSRVAGRVAAILGRQASISLRSFNLGAGNASSLASSTDGPPTGEAQTHPNIHHV